jgi:hypothetical protein
MLIVLLLIACTSALTDTGTDTSGDTADTGAEPIDVPCELQQPFEGASQLQWGGWLEGVRVVEGCGEDEPCTLTDGHAVEAAWHEVTNDRWIDGYTWILNDSADDTRAWVYVWEDSTVIDACRITLH